MIHQPVGLSITSFLFAALYLNLGGALNGIAALLAAIAACGTLYLSVKTYQNTAHTRKQLTPKNGETVAQIVEDTNKRVTNHEEN